MKILGVILAMMTLAACGASDVDNCTKAARALMTNPETMTVVNTTRSEWMPGHYEVALGIEAANDAGHVRRIGMSCTFDLGNKERLFSITLAGKALPNATVERLNKSLGL